MVLVAIAKEAVDLKWQMTDGLAQFEQINLPIWIPPPRLRRDCVVQHGYRTPTLFVRRQMGNCVLQ
jgi:hypothetical protein